MKIVILDGYTLNPGDLSWQGIEALGEVVYYDRTPTTLIAERCQGATVVLTNKAPLSAEVISQLPDLKLISVLATGYNIVDITAAKNHQVTVCNVPGYGTDSVAQHTWALILELCNRVGLHANSVQAGEWVRSPDWCYVKSPIMELAHKTLGIVGFGSIGRQVAAVGKAFGMKIIFHNRSVIACDWAEAVSLETVFATSDIVSLHCPVTPDNQQFVNATLLKQMKPTAFLINTARGQLIHEQDLADVLSTQVIAGAGLDVLSVEPPPAHHPLLAAPNCVLTPHNAWISKEARQRIMQMTVDNIQAFVNQQPIHVVS
ncbi:MAG: D-2-hydroxyacid dehydrogenase [Spirosomataceae bacterium]